MRARFVFAAACFAGTVFASSASAAVVTPEVVKPQVVTPQVVTPAPVVSPAPDPTPPAPASLPAVETPAPRAADQALPKPAPTVSQDPGPDPPHKRLPVGLTACLESSGKCDGLEGRENVEQGYREGARDQWFVQVYPWFETVSGLMGNPDLWSLPPDQTSASFGDAANDLAVEFAEVAGGATKLFDEWLLLEN